MKKKIFKTIIITCCLVVTMFFGASNTVFAITPNWYARNKEAVKIAGNLNLMFKTDKETEIEEDNEELNFNYYFKNLMSKFNFK